MNNTKIMKLTFLWILLVVSAFCTGQTSIDNISNQKKSLDIDSYKEWRRVDLSKISADGKWVIYSFTNIDFDVKDENKLTYLYNTKTGETSVLSNAENINFFNNGKWLKYTLPKSNKEDNENSRDTTVLMCMKNMKKIFWTRNISLSESSKSNIVTYSYTVKTDKGDKKSVDNNNLVIWNIETGDSTVINNIGRYDLYNNRKSIVYISNNGESSCLRAGGIYGKHNTIFKDDNGLLKSFYFNERTGKGGFEISSDSTRKGQPDLMYSFSAKTNSYSLILDKKEISLPEGKVMYDERLSANNKYLFFDMIPRQNMTEKKKDKTKEDKSFELELWSWNDLYVPTRQNSERSSYKPVYPKYVYRIDEKRIVNIGDENTSDIIKPDCKDFNFVIKTDEHPYEKFSDWQDDKPFDLYLVDIRNGETKLFAQKIRKRPIWTPNGKYLLFYDCINKNWNSLDPESFRLTNISKEIGYPVYDESHDKPKPAPSYGIAAWINGGDKLVLYDKYDMWSVDLTGKSKCKCLTNGYGRKNNISLRLVNLEYSLRELDFSKPQMVESFNYSNKNEGIFSLRPNGSLKKLFEGPFSIRIEKISDDGKSCIWTKQSYTEFRDLWFSSIDFSNPVKITNANPQLADYKWGSVRVVKWKNFEGKDNEGLLYLPEDYDKKKSYPTIVSFYETHANGLNSFIVPCLSSAMIDVVTYVSKGYVVFQPDVHYTIGSPGKSAYNAVVSGTKMLIEKGIADKDRIGIQGHSWSGYQAAYLVTQTDMFKCANLGAAVVDMVSAYTGFREGSGRPRMFMYEATQSRMGKSLWEDTEAYIMNSPIFFADKVNTPLLIFHCDADEAVPYAQGLDFFLAMRRLQKPAWLLNYKKERHFLYGKDARIDWTIRMQQFFDFYLKDSPMPRWMKEGISVFEWAKDQKLDPATK